MEDNDHVPEEQNGFCRASKGRKKQLLASKGMFQDCVKREVMDRQYERFCYDPKFMNN
jgi:hypothetical protein